MQFSEETGHAFQDELGLRHVSKQLKYCRKVPKSQLATRLEQLSMQLSKEMGHALQDGGGLMRGSTHLTYF